MIDLSTEEWKEAYRLVQAAAADPADDAARAAAFDFLRTAESKRLLAIAHLLQPGATARSVQAALVPLERVDKRAKITDSEMGIRTTDAPGHVDKAPFAVVADNVVANRLVEVVRPRNGDSRIVDIPVRMRHAAVKSPKPTARRIGIRAARREP